MEENTQHFQHIMFCYFNKFKSEALAGVAQRIECRLQTKVLLV